MFEPNDVIASRPKLRDIFKKELVLNVFSRVEKLDPSIPIYEALKISNEDPKCNLKYAQLYDTAAANTLVPQYLNDEKGQIPLTGAIQNLQALYSEAMVWSILERDKYGNRDPRRIVFYEPASQVRQLIVDSLEINPKWIPAGFTATEYVIKVMNTFKNKTPDILYLSPQYVTQEGNKIVEYSPTVESVINADDFNNLNTLRILNQKVIKSHLVGAVEVTTSGTSTEMTSKVKKFQEYNNTFNNIQGIAYVPILVLDFNKFKELNIKERLKIVKGMQFLQKGRDIQPFSMIGDKKKPTLYPPTDNILGVTVGFVVLNQGLWSRSRKKAIDTANFLTSYIKDTIK